MEQDLYATRTNKSDQARIVIELYVDAETLKQGEEIAQDMLGTAGINSYGIRWKETAWVE